MLEMCIRLKQNANSKCKHKWYLLRTFNVYFLRSDCDKLWNTHKPWDAVCSFFFSSFASRIGDDDVLEFSQAKNSKTNAKNKKKLSDKLQWKITTNRRQRCVDSNKMFDLNRQLCKFAQPQRLLLPLCNHSFCETPARRSHTENSYAITASGVYSWRNRKWRRYFPFKIS